MTTKAHAALTGADLHEPKGVATAPSGTAYIANGSGSGAWSALPFKGGFLHVREDANSGGSAPALNSSSWNTRNLTTIVTNDISASLASSVLTLPAGTYYCFGSAVWTLNENLATSATTQNKLRLRNNTDSITLLNGPSYSSSYFNADVGGVQRNFTPPTSGVVEIRGRFTLLAPKNIVLQHYSVNGGGTGGSGLGTAEVEVFSELLFWQV